MVTSAHQHGPHHHGGKDEALAQRMAAHDRLAYQSQVVLRLGQMLLSFGASAYRVKKYVGAYAAALGGIDLLVFTAGVGENRAAMRTEVCQGLEFLGIKLDESINEVTYGGKSQVISAADSRVKVVVVATDEEYMIARDTYDILNK